MTTNSYVDATGATRTEDTRNIDERFRWWDHGDIVAELDNDRSPMISIFFNEIRDFNLSSAVRNNLVYNTSGVIIVATADGNGVEDVPGVDKNLNPKRWDRRGSVGSHLYQNMSYSTSIEETIADLHARGYRVVAAELDERAVSLPSYSWQDKTAVIYGEEGAGLSQYTLSLVDDIVYIPQRGSVRSLNVANSCGMFLYDYSVKRGYIS